MADQENEKWLDELISQTINTTRPQFDAEKWKQKYPQEFQSLLSRARRRPAGSSARQPNIRAVFFHHRLTKLAAAAVILVAIGLVVTYLGPGKPIAPENGRIVGNSPSEMLSMMSLTIAYRRGGMEELERQCDKAVELLGPRLARISFREVLDDLSG
jgi:hypothetical protein